MTRFHFLLTFLLAFPYSLYVTAQDHIVVNEVCVANIDQFIDNSFNYGGWIELYNPTSSDIDLSYWYVSDDPSNPTKARLAYAFGSIPAKGCKVLCFDHHSNDGQYGPNASRQVRMKLNPEGGTIYIYNRSRQLITSEHYPAAISRCSYARTADGGSIWRWSATPTPGYSNAGMTFADEQAASPVPSLQSSLMTAPAMLHVTCPTGSTLVYTTDGSTPTLTNGTSTTARVFSITRTGVWRFRTFHDAMLPSEVVTRSFIFRDKDYTLPIVSVVTDPKNLYDDSLGVYTIGVNGAAGRGIDYKSNKNMDWERPVNFDYITSDGKSAINQEATFYISGGWSRHWPPTSFKLKAEKRYRLKNTFDYPFFDSKPFIKHKVVLMRNGGNDGNRCKDVVLQRILLSSGFYVNGQEWNPCHVFLNGKYLAMLNMREPNNKFFGYSNYGIDTDNMDAFEIGEQGFKFMAGDNTVFNRWYTLSNTSDTQASYDAIRDIVDIDGYANYMAAECYLGLSDWLSNNNNLKGFRSRDNGRFHMVLFDLDSALDFTNLLSILYGNSKNPHTVIFNRMLKNASFRRQFINAYCLVDGSIFTDQRVKEAADFVGKTLEKPLSFDGISPWGTCNYIVSTVSKTRTSRIADLRSVFSLTSGSHMQIGSNISHAAITLDGQPIPTGRFNGTLFAPFTLSATAPAGYNFAGWRRSSTQTMTVLPRNSIWRYYDRGPLDHQPWTTASDATWNAGKAPLGYGKDGVITTLDYGTDTANKRPTYYFRTSVTLSDSPSDDDTVMLNYTADDGFILYVNGIEAARHLMSDATPSYSTFATTFSSGNPDSGTEHLPASLFRKGTNEIAVEVHNNAPTSSDIYWDAEIAIAQNTITENLDSRTITVDKDNDCTLTAMFVPISNECLAAAGSTLVVINEISAANTIYANEYFKRNDWIELHNTTDSAIDVAGMYLTDDAAMPEKFTIAANGTDVSTIIPAHGFLVIWADKLNAVTQLHADFKLANADSQCVILTAADRTWADTLYYPMHMGDETIGRYPDGGKRVFRMNSPTIGKPNIINSYAQWITGVDENFDEEAYITGVTPQHKTAIPADRHIYDLQGRRLSVNDKSRLNKGIYIIDGRKTVVR